MHALNYLSCVVSLLPPIKNLNYFCMLRYVTADLVTADCHYDIAVLDYKYRLHRTAYRIAFPAQQRLDCGVPNSWRELRD